MTDDMTMNEDGGPYAGQDRFECRTDLVADLRGDGRPGQDRAAPPLRGPLPALRTPSSSRASRRSGSCASSRWPSRRWRPCAMAASASCPSALPRSTMTGWRTSATGASPASCGGGIASRCGTAMTAASRFARAGSHRSVRSAAAQNLRQDEDVLDTWFSSGLWPFSHAGLAGRDRGSRPTFTRPRCWRPATTSSSSGWRA